MHPEELISIRDYDNATFADFALGYYFNNPDLNITLNYRGMKTSALSYGTEQEIKRNSLGLEVTKFLFDYHGFVPFAGPIFNYEFLGFSERHDDSPSQDLYLEKPAMGVTLGWDIRPNRLQSFILRTNLRWYPRLRLAVSQDQQINFGGLEFNFIQLIIYRRECSENTTFSLINWPCTKDF